MQQWDVLNQDGCSLAVWKKIGAGHLQDLDMFVQSDFHSLEQPTNL